MSDLGKLTYYISIEVLQHDSGIMLKQERYTTKNLEEGGMEGCNAFHAPMDSILTLSKSPEERRIDEKEYRSKSGAFDT